MSFGLDIFPVPEISKRLLDRVGALGYSFLAYPFIHPRYKKELSSGKVSKHKDLFSRSDLNRTRIEWNKSIVGKLSPYLQLDTDDERIRRASEAVFLQELEFAKDVCVPTILLKLTSTNCLNMARLLNSKLTESYNYQVWVHVTLTDSSKTENQDNSWDWWNTFRTYCHYNKKLSVALELSKFMPNHSELEKWAGEPVKCLIIRTDIFFKNLYQHKVLSVEHQEVIRYFLRLNVQFIIRCKNKEANLWDYCQYMLFLRDKKLYTPNITMEKLKDTEDVLQDPIQPLSDNLQTMVYEVFEKDPYKYNQYQYAVQNALKDISSSNPTIKEFVVMVMGAGRGPLIRAVFNASITTNQRVKVFALEKNPFAVNTLHALNRELWYGKVTVISGDMRNFEPKEKADIIVSELLGSFGDNELSPECLDGAQRFLKEDGICIPVSYTSWIAPIQSTKLFNQIIAIQPIDKPLQACFETPYVVNFVNKYNIDRAKPLFTFTHPNRDEVIDNKRYKTVKFICSQNCVLTGIAGYFSSVLYKDIQISTEPITKTKNMISWFPILFPFSEPIQLKKGETIEIAFWRCESETQVWYEWSLVQPKIGPIHNINGRSYTMSKSID